MLLIEVSQMKYFSWQSVETNFFFFLAFIMAITTQNGECIPLFQNYFSCSCNTRFCVWIHKCAWWNFNITFFTCDEPNSKFHEDLELNWPKHYYHTYKERDNVRIILLWRFERSQIKNLKSGQRKGFRVETLGLFRYSYRGKNKELLCCYKASIKK